MENTCDVPAHLHDHNYWRREPSRSQSSTNSHRAAESRKRKREQESSSRALEEPPERRLRENAAVPSDWSPSPQPSTSAPQARLEGVQLEQRTAGERQQDSQPTALQEPGDDGEHPLRPSPYGPQPGGLPPSAFNAVVEMIMSWMTDSPYNPEM